MSGSKATESFLSCCRKAPSAAGPSKSSTWIKDPCHIKSYNIFQGIYFHLWPKKVVGLLGSSHDDWDHLPRADHVEELLGYIIGTIVVLKSQVEPGKFRFN